MGIRATHTGFHVQRPGQFGIQNRPLPRHRSACLRGMREAFPEGAYRSGSRGTSALGSSPEPRSPQECEPWKAQPGARRHYTGLRTTCQAPSSGLSTRSGSRVSPTTSGPNQGRVSPQAHLPFPLTDVRLSLPPAPRVSPLGRFLTLIAFVKCLSDDFC